MPGEPFLRPKPAPAFATLTPVEFQQLEGLFDEARTKLRNYIRWRRLERVIPDEAIERAAYEGAAKAVRSAKGTLTSGFIATAMKHELSRFWRTDEGKGRVYGLDNVPLKLQKGLEVKPDQERRLEEGRGEIEAATAVPDEAAQDLSVFNIQPSLLKKRVYYAVQVKGATPRRVAKLLQDRAGQPRTTREVNRLAQRTTDDLAFTRATAKCRDREIRKALEKCVPDDRHREALEANLTRGQSTRQLAERYGVSHVAVHKWIVRAKQRLIEHLRQYGPQEVLETLLTSDDQNTPEIR